MAFILPDHVGGYLTGRDGWCNRLTDRFAHAYSDSRFAIAAYRFARLRYPGRDSEDVAIDIDSELDGGQLTKVGLGNSAAVSVAVATALFAAARRSPALQGFRRELLTTAMSAHRAAQDGVGSGADVAACVCGGLIRFHCSTGAMPSIVPLPLPPDVYLLVGWSGTAACTRELVHRFQVALAKNDARRRVFLRSSRACVDEFVDALARGRVSLAALDANGQLLEQLAEECQLPLLTPALRDLLRIARSYGAAAKMAGGGGGDCGIALTRDADVAMQIAAAWRAHGIEPLDLAVGGDGVTIASH